MCHRANLLTLRHFILIRLYCYFRSDRVCIHEFYEDPGMEVDSAPVGVLALPLVVLGLALNSGTLIGPRVVSHYGVVGENEAKVHFSSAAFKETNFSREPRP